MKAVSEPSCRQSDRKWEQVLESTIWQRLFFRRYDSQYQANQDQQKIDEHDQGYIISELTSVYFFSARIFVTSHFETRITDPSSTGIEKIEKGHALDAGQSRCAQARTAGPWPRLLGGT
jgi:hypothetical protein